MFAASGRVITFHGFLKAYVEGTDDAAAAATTTRRPGCPTLAEGDAVSAASVSACGHETKPPARYTEATLIKELEDREIGRPVDVRLDHRHDPQPRLRLQEGHRAGAGLAGVLGDPAARGALRPAGLLRVHRRHGGRPRRDRRRPRRTAITELSEFYFGSDQVEGLHPLVTELGEIDAKELATFPVGGPRQRHRAAGRPLRPLPRGSRRRGQPARASGPTCPRTCRPTS